MVAPIKRNIYVFSDLLLNWGFLLNPEMYIATKQDYLHSYEERNPLVLFSSVFTGGVNGEEREYLNLYPCFENAYFPIMQYNLCHPELCVCFCGSSVNPYH